MATELLEKTRGTPLGHAAKKEEIVQLVSFIVGNEVFGVSILSVQEIIRMANITPIPNAPDFIEGVINLRGKVIPIVDLKKRLNIRVNAERDKERERILVIEIAERIIGFIVDAVSKVIKIPTDSIEPPPDIVVAGVESEYIKGVSKLDDKTLLIILDFNNIFLKKEMQKLKEAS
jgi:purine-binding chemotaxis protein CheW